MVQKFIKTFQIDENDNIDYGRRFSITVYGKKWKREIESLKMITIIYIFNKFCREISVII